ncbi:MAG TPA: hypothetical protein VIK93_01800 [Limnochordales bacterium]
MSNATQGGSAGPGTWAVATAYVGTVVGAGFASGQETLQFFTAYGPLGLAGLVVAALLFAWFGVRVLLLGRELNAVSHGPLIRWLAGPQLAPILDGLLVFFLLGTAATMVSGASATMLEQYGWPRAYGALLMAGAATLTVLTGLRGVVNALAFFAPLLVGSVLAIAFYSLATGPGVAGAMAWPGDPGLAAAGPWWIGAVLYVAYNMVLAIPILGSLGAAVRQRPTLVTGGALGGVLLALGAGAIHLTVASFMPEAGALDIPMLYAARSLPAWVPTVYSALLWGEVYTTAVAMLFSFAARIGPEGGPCFRAAVIGGGVLALVGGLFRFSQVIGTFYPLMGLLGIVLLLLLLRPLPGSRA